MSNKDYKIDLPNDVAVIIETLENAGFQAYAVGGAVRDSLLGDVPKDWDVTTDAKPEEVKALFKRTIDTGIEHGTVTVRLHGKSYEVTTFRIDGKYIDSRRPEDVSFTRSLYEDIKRRDFTINALAYNNKEGLIDYCNGVRDLENHVINCVGEPDRRFSEDALRILRALRFSARLSFSIEENTKKAIKDLAPTLKNISAERIAVELENMLLTDNTDIFKTAYKLGVTKVILPEFDAMMETEQNTEYHFLNVGEHTLLALKNTPKDRIIRWTVLLHDVAKPVMHKTDEMGVSHFKGHAAEGKTMAQAILKRLKFDNDTIKRVGNLVYYHDYRIDSDSASVRKLASMVGEDFPLLIEVQRADTKAHAAFVREERLKVIDNISKEYKRIIEAGEPLKIGDLDINGNELQKIGVKRGPLIGEILKTLLMEVLEDPELNKKELLEKRALTIMENRDI